MRIRRLWHVIFPSALSVFAGDLSGQGVPTVEGARVEVAPSIDGVLDEPVWALAPPLTDFVQFEPPPADLPVTLAALTMVEASGISTVPPSGGLDHPCGLRPMRRE